MRLHVTSNRLISVLFKGKKDISKSNVTWSNDFSLFLIRSSLESLPNELLFMIIAHMSSSDLLQAFYGLNHRFNLIVYQSARHFTISKDTNETMLAELKPNIKKWSKRSISMRNYCHMSFYLHTLTRIFVQLYFVAQISPL
jgi:hypothetical protein